MGIQKFAKCSQLSSGDLRVCCQVAYLPGHFPVLIEQLRYQIVGLHAGTASSRKDEFLLDHEVLLQMSIEKISQPPGLQYRLWWPFTVRCRATAHQALRQYQTLVMVTRNRNQSRMSFRHEINHHRLSGQGT